ncbi:MAG: hypothetical protein PHH98_02690 [Candidatus Gracilibacteria bacterium]|nr:hypothetical protein [Candidatus Gracilibacteria bacterium]
MHKKITIIILFILLLFFVNFSSLRSYYYNNIGEKYFIKDDLEQSLKYFKKAGDDFGKYNEGNISYKNSDFSGAIINYESILNTNSNDLLFRINHNLGNSYYRVGEKSDDTIKKASYEKAVLFYSGALNIREDKETRANLEFVLKKLEEEEKKNKDDKSEQQEKNGDENNSGTGSENSSGSGSQDNSGTGSENKSGSGSQNSDSSKENSTQSNSGSTSQDKNASSTQNQGGDNNLSQEELKAISDYKKMLQKQQDYNSEGFNKVYEGDGRSDLFDAFFNNSLLNQDNKKDW